MSDYESIMYDAMMDAAHEAEYNHWYLEIVEDFKRETLLTFFDDNPEMLQRSFVMEDEAKKLIDISPSATIILAFTAIETAIKRAILQPMLYGMTHNENVVNLIVQKFLKQSNVDAYIGLAFDLVEQAIDLKLSDTKTNGEKLIVSEIKVLAKKRNSIVHSAILFDKEDAEYALQLLDEVYEKIIARMLSGIGFAISGKNIYRIEALIPDGY